MKSIVCLALALWCLLPTVAAPVPGGLRVFGPVTPSDDTDEYATHDARWGRGGHRTVADINARNAIPMPRREPGMLVWVEGVERLYRLRGDLTNWTEFGETVRAQNRTELLSLGRLSTNAVVQLLGFHAAGDGGGGSFFYSPGSTATNLPNAPATGGAMVRLGNWDGDVRACGAKCDGIADDGPALRAAWAASESLGYRIRLPRGTNRIVLSGDVGIDLLVTNTTKADREIRPTIIGAGGWNTTLLLEGPGTGIRIRGVASGTIDGLGSVFLRGVKLQGFRVRGDGVSQQTGIHLQLATFDSQLDDLVVERLGNADPHRGMILDGCWYMRIGNLWWSPAGWGNFGIDLYNPNEVRLDQFLSHGAVGNSTNSWDMKIRGAEASEWKVSLGSHARYGVVVEQYSDAGGSVNRLFGQSEGPATAFLADRIAPQSYSALTNVGTVAYVVSPGHAQFIGRYVTLSGVTPSEYNGTWYVLSAPSTDVFTLQLGADPGGPGSGGTWQPDAWAQGWDVQLYGWSYAGAIHNQNTNINRPFVDIRRGRDITVHDSSLGTLTYRTAVATNVQLRFLQSGSIWYPYLRAQFTNHPFAAGDVVALRNATNALHYGLTTPGRATNVSATEVWWPIPGLTRTSDATNSIETWDLGSSGRVAAPNFAVQIGPGSYNVRLKDNAFFNYPPQDTIWDEQDWPPATDTRVLSWDSRVPRVVYAGTLTNLNTELSLASADVNPWGRTYRFDFLRHRPVAVWLKCLVQPLYLSGVTNEWVSFRVSSPGQHTVSQQWSTNAVQSVLWRAADMTVSNTYSTTVRVPTDRFGNYTWQIQNPNPNVGARFELTQVGVEVE